MLSRLVKAAVIAALLAMVIDSLPDIRRYVERAALISTVSDELIERRQARRAA